MEEIEQEAEAERAAGFISVVKLFRMRSLRWQVISVVILMGGQQLSGVNAVGAHPGPGRRARCRPWPGPARQPRLCLPDLLLRRPDLQGRRGPRRRRPVRDGGHGRCQRGRNRPRRECPWEPSPVSYHRGGASWPRKEPGPTDVPLGPSCPTAGLSSDDTLRLAGGSL